MAIIFGSARHDEHGACYSGGAAGDQLQTGSANDTIGEVSMQDFYLHTKGWYILRPKSVTHADAMASLMKKACNNAHIGYDQLNRLGVVRYGIGTTTATECDCSSLVREIVKEVTGKDPGDFTTANEASALLATGLFEEKVAYISQAKTPVYNGDVLVTKTKGHTGIIVSGNPRNTASATVVKVDSAKSKDSSLAGTYTTTANLNMRAGAGTGKQVLKVLPKGTKVRCYGYYTAVNGKKWLYVTADGQTGFCSQAYLKK